MRQRGPGSTESTDDFSITLCAYDDDDAKSIRQSSHCSYCSRCSRCSRNTFQFMSRAGLRKKRCLLFLLFIALLLFWISAGVLFVLKRVFPEISMVINSQCPAPLKEWDGKLLYIRIWKDYLHARPGKFNIKRNIDPDSFDRRRRLKGSWTEEMEVASNDSEHIRLQEIIAKTSNINEQQTSRPVIFWGSHHKTGTYLASKIFSLVCARMNWCCIFHVTRDTFHAVRQSLTKEHANVVGHNQWIWFPEELGVPYKFVHFYRHPFRKIVSGFRYHRDGAEPWTKSLKVMYKMICSSELATFRRNSSQAGFMAARRYDLFQHETHVGRDAVIDHCSFTHLCETCCRREHEFDVVMGGKIENGHHGHNNWKYNETSSNVNESEHGAARVFRWGQRYALRPQEEYDFLCSGLGQVKGNLIDALQQMPLDSALLAEASIDFYENFRMARIVNRTWNDPNTLNVDIDDMNNRQKFSATVRRIIRHLELDISSSDEEAIVNEIGFFDLSSSPIYRWFMANPLTNHIHLKEEETAEITKALIKNTNIMRGYEGIINLLQNTPAEMDRRKRMGTE